MASRTCEGCSRDVRIGGGMANLWTLEGGTTAGMTVELDDGTEYFLCFECVEALPNEPTNSDVDQLPERDQDTETADDGGAKYVFLGLLLGAAFGIALGITFDDTGFWLSFGLAVGFAIGLIGGRLREVMTTNEA